MTELTIDKMLETAIKTQDLNVIAELPRSIEIDKLRLGEDNDHPLMYLAKQVQKQAFDENFVGDVIDEFIERGIDLLAREKASSTTLASEVLALQSLPKEDNERLMVHSIYRSLRLIGTDPESLVREMASVAVHNNKDIRGRNFKLRSPFKPMREMLDSLQENLNKMNWHEARDVEKSRGKGRWNVQALLDVVEDHEKELGGLAYRNTFGGFAEVTYVETVKAPNQVMTGNVTIDNPKDDVIKNDIDVAKLVIAEMKEKYVGQDNPINQAQSMMMRDAFDKRRLAGKDAPKQSMHMRFEGPSGTGKTSMARDYADLLHAMGRSNGEFIELTREKLVGAHIGKTEEITKEFIEKAMGGVLFIDEIHNLVVKKQDSSDTQDFGHRVVEALVGAMENNREDLTIIVAGYTGDIERFLDSDRGLRDRFARVVTFEAYDEDTLSKIMDLNLAQHHLTMSDEVKQQAIKGVMDYKEAVGDRNFGNARVVRNFVEQLPDEMANRVGMDETLLDVSPEELNAVKIPDVDAYVKRLLDGASNSKNNKKSDDASSYSGTKIGFTAKL